MNWYFFFKALHIIGFVAWFAAIFYIVRLFVYHREAWNLKDASGKILRKQYHIMETRLYSIIQTPAMVLTWVGGIGMLILNSAWLKMPWLHVKLLLLVALVFYHFSCAYYIKALKEQPTKKSSFGYRLYNELPTLLLIAIVMLAVWKSLAGLWIGLIVLLCLGALFFVAARLYKQKRTRS